MLYGQLDYSKITDYSCMNKRKYAQNGGEISSVV